MNRGLRKGIRTLLQLVAGGSLTALVNLGVGGLEPNVKAMLLAAWTVVLAYAQNSLEEAGKISVLLPSPPASVTEAGISPPPGPVTEESTPGVDSHFIGDLDPEAAATADWLSRARAAEPGPTGDATGK